MNAKVSDGVQQYMVFRFSQVDVAAMFKDNFSDIPFNPEDRVGKLWKRPPGDVRRPAMTDPYDLS
ncbi:hypothetical protein EON80_10075 [bacterium]|nr:MAG: hypothetical protein EON80_10075 [bacterium]